MAKEYILTDEGLKKYEAELETLKTVTRKEIAEKIKVALSFGDLSENSEYDEAKNDQAKVESRILELEAILKNARVIDESDINTDVVLVGVKVKLEDMDFNEVVEYQIVGASESDPRTGKISDESPVGKALLGHSVGETVEVEVPVGTATYKILDISK